ncbi:MAG: glucuronate isomerase, partial [Clostridia bacterium]|nr:glucuronate isomerase [Clostridia bacterium]
MKQFMERDFLLGNPTAKTLYHDYAAKMPLVDYHCHIDPREIYENRQFENITQIWLGGDHYKWRIMRSNGVSEEFITGNAPDRDKFQKFAEALPRCVGNPMYHWCHLELKTYFGYEGVLNGETAEKVWQLCNEKLKTMRARDFIADSNVAMIGTTDDPCSDLAYHALIAKEGLDCKVCPSFRPDPALNMHKPGFAAYIEKLGKTAGMEIKTLADVKAALSVRMDHFAAHDCRASD